jgi:two-component system, OmpR family, alkaline phosphatase synthesis response regulator PhoP
MNQSILFVEDEEALGMVLSDRLRAEGYAVEIARDGITGFQKATSQHFDVMILDIMLPGRSGLDLCRDIRLAGVDTPILLLTARDAIADKVVGLKLGADDYVTKPFDMRELVTRIEALLRRCTAPTATSLYVVGSIRVDVSAREVTREGTAIRLSAMEFRLLRFLLKHPGIGLSREKILKEVWGHYEVTSSRTLDVHVASLRHKLETDPARPELLVTVKNFGYMYTGKQGSASEMAAKETAGAGPSNIGPGF